MASRLFSHMLTVYQKLEEQFGVPVKEGRLIRAMKTERLSEEELIEIKRTSFQRMAKRVVKALSPLLPLLEWASSDSQRIEAISTREKTDAIAEEQRVIKQLRRGIAELTEALEQHEKRLELLLADAKAEEGRT